MRTEDKAIINILIAQDILDADYFRDVKASVLESMQNEGNNFWVETVDSLPEIVKDRLVTVYEKNGFVDDEANFIISRETKVKQGMLFAGACYVVSPEGTVALFTANEEVATMLGAKRRIKLDELPEENANGVLRAYKLVIESDGGDVEFKCTLPNKGIGENDILVPYGVVMFLVVLLNKILTAKDRVFKVVSSSLSEGGIQNKTRYVTLSKNILEKKNGKNFIDNITGDFVLPHLGFMYAPILGADSIFTTGMTRLDVLRMDEFRVAKYEDYHSQVESGDPARNAIGVRLAVNKLLLSEDLWKSKELFEELPKVEEFFNLDEGLPSSGDLSHYIYSLTEHKKGVLFKRLGILDELDKYMSMFSNAKVLEPKEGYWSEEELRVLLKDCILQILIQKTDGSFSKIICTNNVGILKELYGEEYYKQYEGFNPRYQKCKKLLSEGMDVMEALEKCGLLSETTLKGMDNDEAMEIVNNPEKWQAREKLAELNNTNTVRTSENGNILVRLCFATIVDGGSVNYYRSIKPKRVLKVVCLKDTF
jgi:hypothetical protein